MGIRQTTVRANLLASSTLALIICAAVACSEGNQIRGTGSTNSNNGPKLAAAGASQNNGKQNNGTEHTTISNNGSGSGSGTGNEKTGSEDGGPAATDIGAGDGSSTSTTSSGPHLQATSSVPVVAISYPAFRLNGTGMTHCKDGDHGPYAINTNVKSNFAADKLETTRNSTVVNCNGDSDCESNINPGDIATKNATDNTFTRLQAADITALQKAAPSYYSDAMIFAKTASWANAVPTAFNYTFDGAAPLPVSPWPADGNRYKTFTTQSWSTHASGGASPLTITVTATKVSQDAHSVVIHMVTELAEADSSGNWDLYTDFPNAYDQVFHIDTDKQAITGIDTIGRANTTDPDNCDANVITTFTLTTCDENIAGKTVPLGCTYNGQ